MADRIFGVFDDLIAGRGSTISLRRIYLEMLREKAEIRNEERLDPHEVAYIEHLTKQIEQLADIEEEE
jgi:hypothetical protein